MTTTKKKDGPSRMKNLTEVAGDEARPSFIFVPEILNLIDLDEPIAIGSQAHLHRATDALRHGLSNILQPYVDTRRMLSLNPWEHREERDHQGMISYRPIIDPAQYQYWVVSHWRRYFDVSLEAALELSEPSLTPMISLINANKRSSGQVNSHALVSWLENNYSAVKIDVSAGTVAEIARIYEALKAIEPWDQGEWQFIGKAIEDFQDLKVVSRDRPLYIVGLMAIIEYLLTTNHDQSKDISLTHQLQTKIDLVQHRFRTPLDPANFFGKGAPALKSIIKHLYQYRSAIAHGSFSGVPQVLANHEAACNFLHTLVRRLILQALEEPQLISDLKGC